MNEPVTLLLLRHLFPEWTIARVGEGGWWAAGRVLVSASDLDELLASLVVADPDATRRAVGLLRESG
ncbi:hypothetical protein E1293_05615 [Actinomadura darangshiensis]|uniref:Uncharacterized protein n=1 Tax=Actinomadura darangshiensis TaxID=705336 RepID=A0A4R5BS93_9ACTN|nr:hypothetical protein [Actinomadura darangshiensis]TDD88879.1 hypothetical protein E1293_05615 [Actinomadura darangshiensis]